MSQQHPQSSEPAAGDRSHRQAIVSRRQSVNSVARVIIRAYSEVVLRLSMQGKKGPMVRDLAFALTAELASKAAGMTVTPADVETALAKF